VLRFTQFTLSHFRELKHKPEGAGEIKKKAIESQALKIISTSSKSPTALRRREMKEKQQQETQNERRITK
jgi:hypothetical protein